MASVVKGGVDHPVFIAAWGDTVFETRATLSRLGIWALDVHMASLASRCFSISLPQKKTTKQGVFVAQPGRCRARLLASPKKATAGVAEVADALIPADLASALADLPVKEASQFILEHPVASFSLSVAALFLVPKLIEAFIRYLAAPVAIALLAFYVLEFPEESAVIITTVLDWVNANPELTSVLVLGLALFGLAPALLTACAATALVYGLLSVTFGTQLDEVREMQGTFGETLSRVQFYSSIAANRMQQLLK